jgi:hypothetical protein
MEMLSMALMDVGKSVVGVSIAQSLKIPEKLNFGDSFVMTHASNGALYTAISDVIDFASGGESKFMNMDVYGIADTFVFLSALSGASELTNVDQMAYDVLNKQAGLSRDMSAIISESMVLSTGRIAARVIDETPEVPSWLRLIRHPSNARNMY